ncbi:MAG: hypothetical protein COA47_11020 [Robiginitomaculum sp.]|nr:MAG: hypothetical protein COA47_11020 [Robiginitomaculum sp.]
MTNRFYIIGNGFDLHHKIPSSYWDFGKYLKIKDFEIYELIEQFIGVDEDFWNFFEDRLSDLNHDHLLEYTSDFLMSYGADDWSDSYHHDYQFEVTRVVEALSQTLLAHFSDWIRQLHIPSLRELSVSPIPFDINAQYLSFNYTNTLQKTYKIPDANILYIHGLADSTSDLVLGHGYKLPDKNPYRYEQNPEDADTRVIEAISIIDGYFEQTFKNTDSVLKKYSTFFTELGEATEISVYGHSLEAVDAPYFKKILSSINAPKVHWIISFHNDLPKMKEKAAQLNIDPMMTKFIKLEDL